MRPGLQCDVLQRCPDEARVRSEDVDHEEREVEERAVLHLVRVLEALQEELAPAAYGEDVAGLHHKVGSCGEQLTAATDAHDEQAVRRRAALRLGNGPADDGVRRLHAEGAELELAIAGDDVRRLAGEAEGDLERARLCGEIDPEQLGRENAAEPDRADRAEHVGERVSDGDV